MANPDPPPTPAAEAPPAPTVPAPTVPAPTVPATPPWTPPDTLSEKFSRWSRRAVQLAVIALGFCLLALFVLWIVPTVAVSRSPDYAVACRAIQSDLMIEYELGAPVTCDRLPSRFLLSGDRTVFVIRASGSSGRTARVAVRVEAGAVKVGGVQIVFE